MGRPWRMPATALLAAIGCAAAWPMAYDVQIGELDRIAALEGGRPAPAAADPPALLSPAPPGARCVVTNATATGCCAGCGAVCYASAAEQRVDWRYHGPVCSRLAAAAAAAAAPGTTAPPAGPTPTVVELAHQWEGMDAALSEAFAPIATAANFVYWGFPASLPRLWIVFMGANELEARMAGPWYPLLLGLLDGRVGELRISVVGPDLPAPADIVEARLQIDFHRATFHDWLRTVPAGSAPDLVVGLHCGLMLYPSWRESIAALVASGIPSVFVSYREWEARAELRLLQAMGAAVLQPPTANPFGSKQDRQSATVANDVFRWYSFVLAVRGQAPARREL